MLSTVAMVLFVVLFVVFVDSCNDANGVFVICVDSCKGVKFVFVHVFLLFIVVLGLPSQAGACREDQIPGTLIEI